MKKILIANRGEIAVRIIRACKDAGYKSVAVASDADKNALHAQSADEVHFLPGNSPVETYLNQAAVLNAAKQSGADAVHPGYGLLSENETFAAAVKAAGLTWIGPSPEVIALLGDKVNARAVAKKVGAPLLPSLDDGAITSEKAHGFVAEHGLPVIIKAQNGGGGRGMRIVRDADEIDVQLAAAEREAGLAFGRPECFIERYAEHARHVETQCLADSHGNVAVLSTRDCTLQRRQQKLIEEAPAPFLEQSQISQLVRASIGILRDVGYQGAATCEFLITPQGEIFFLEVNTRVQVEHPVTEEVTGIDIIREMFKIAEGGTISTEHPPLRGHSIEFRINAEDPWVDFKPTPGKLTKLVLPGGPGVRVDFGYREGDTVPPFYDSLMGKLIVTGSSREEALQRARRALAELRIEGAKTIVPLHRAILGQPEFAAAAGEDFKVYTRWIDTEMGRLSEAASAAQDAVTPTVQDEVITLVQIETPQSSEGPGYRVGVKAPLSGTVLEICVSEGDAVAKGDLVAVMEAMKMEQSVTAEVAGVVSKINVAQGSFIEIDEDLMGLD